ncbi:unnamed protein product [Rhizoctonia solani]|uniref:Uncharacterized protein n=1 Tax=Rhizoctonia solani TaxID=456999 RepID=A0A8H3BDN9_9AGAM|nr:unnamed protein product [Rhizoctonia solani]
MRMFKWERGVSGETDKSMGRWKRRLTIWGGKEPLEVGGDEGRTRILVDGMGVLGGPPTGVNYTTNAMAGLVLRCDEKCPKNILGK